jgi:hypothetical protein
MKTGPAILLLLLSACLAGCVLFMDSLDRVHYGMTKNAIIARLGNPDHIQKSLISTEADLKAVHEEADPTTGTLRFAKLGDWVHVYTWVHGNKTLVVTFLDEDNKPAQVFTREPRI